MGTSDVWVGKINKEGRLIWQMCLGGDKNEDNSNLILNKDNSITIFCNTLSPNGSFSSNKGLSDIGIAKISTEGELLWNKSFGSIDNDFFSEMTLNEDGSYYLLTNSHSLFPNLNTNTSTSNLISVSNNGKINWNLNLRKDATHISAHMFTPQIIKRKNNNILLFLSAKSKEKSSLQFYELSNSGKVLNEKEILIDAKSEYPVVFENINDNYTTFFLNNLKMSMINQLGEKIGEETLNSNPNIWGMKVIQFDKNKFLINYLSESRPFRNSLISNCVEIY